MRVALEDGYVGNLARPLLAAYATAQPQLVTFASACLVHRAELMQFGGEWAEAMAEAERAADRGAGSPDGAEGAALYPRAEILRTIALAIMAIRRST